MLTIFIAWLANAFIVAGLWGVAEKRRDAFLLSIVGEGLYVGRSLILHDYALAAVCVIFAAMAGRAYVMWGEPTPRWVYGLTLVNHLTPEGGYGTLILCHDDLPAGCPSVDCQVSEFLLEHREMRTLEREIDRLLREVD